MVLNHAVVWDATFSVKTIAINAAVTTSGTGRTFTITDSVVQGNAPVTIGAGNTIAGVEATNTPWQLSTAYSPTACVLNLVGTTGSHVAVRDFRFTNGSNNGGGIVVADFVDFLRVGTATHFAFSPYLNGFERTFRLVDCTLTACGQTSPGGPSEDAIGGGISAIDSFVLERCTWTATAAAVAVSQAAGTTRTTGVWRVVDDEFDGYVDLYSGGFTITGTPSTSPGTWTRSSNRRMPGAGWGGILHALRPGLGGMLGRLGELHRDAGGRDGDRPGDSLPMAVPAVRSRPPTST